jgi:hypothetical protein
MSGRTLFLSALRRPELVRVFLLGELAAQGCPPIRRQILEHAASELKRLEPLRDSLELSESDTDFNGRAALEFGLRDAAVEEQWANWQVAAIDERAQK